MDRATGRALAKTTLEATGLVGKAFLSMPESFGQYNPAAVIESKSLAMIQDDRDEDDFTSPAEIWVNLFLRRPREATETEKDAIEFQLDTLTRAAMRALYSAFFDEAANLVIGPSTAGYPNREFDSSAYRVERFAIQFDDDDP